MKQNILPFLIVMVMGMGCVNDELSQDCIKGRVLGYDRCNQVFVIQIISGNLKGDSLKLFGREFDNVVQFPHSPNSTIFSKREFQEEDLEQELIIFFNYRIFDPEKDEWPESTVVCPMIIGPHNLPSIIITRYSTLNCPIDHEK